MRNVLFLTLIVLAIMVLSSSLANSQRINLVLHVAVVAYDPSHSVLNGLVSENYTYSIVCGNISISLVAMVRYVYAPNWSLSTFRDYMESHYVEGDVPAWVESYTRNHSLDIRWLELRPFYEFLWRLSNEVVSKKGLEPEDVIAIIGNIDNVSRQYYEEPTHYVHAPDLTGVRGWVGEHRFAFYDLSVVPRPWPSRTTPFYGTGRAVNVSTEPPIWSLEDPARYVRELVHDHIRFHYLTLCSRDPWYTHIYHLHLILVDYGNENITLELLSRINTSLVKDLLGLIDPWINVVIDYHVVRPEPDSLLYRVLSSAEYENGWLILYYGNTSKLLRLDAEKRFPDLNPCGIEPLQDSCDFVFLCTRNP